MTTISHTVRVVNTGSVCSAVSVQAFISSDHADAVTNEELYDFNATRVLSPGESQLLDVTLPAQTLALVDDGGDRRIEPGQYCLRIGGSGSGATRDADFVVLFVTLEGPPTFLWRLSEAKKRWADSQKRA